MFLALLSVLISGPFPFLCIQLVVRFFPDISPDFLLSSVGIYILINKIVKKRGLSRVGVELKRKTIFSMVSLFEV